jgi:cell division cycle 2-like
MSSKGRSRWADAKEDAALQAQLKKEKEEKRRLKAEKQRKLETPTAQPAAGSSGQEPQDENESRAKKRRRLSTEPEEVKTKPKAPETLDFPAGEWGPCRHVDNFEKLNHIEEGSYGWVSRAKETATGEIVALKKLKMEPANDGFPVTGLREIQTLSNCSHPSIVKLREVVMGDSMSEYVPLRLT